VDSVAGFNGVRYPIRGTLFGCCASAMTTTASSNTTNRIDKTLAFFIAHIIRYVSRGTVLEETEIYDGRRQGFFEWLEIELIDALVRSLAGLSCRRIQFNPSVARGYLITLSALASTFGGIVRPICLAVLRLMISSNFFGCSTGRSAGLVPFKILSTYVAARRDKSIKFVA
jgi:hypothetical protein